MPTTIMGHTLTAAERRVLDAILIYVRRDAGGEPNTSVSGERWIPLLEIFPRSARGTAERRTAARLYTLGILAACEVAYRDACVRSSIDEHFQAAKIAGTANA